MKIEEAIKQKSFNSMSHKLSVNFIYTYSWILNAQKDFFQEFGLTPQQFNVLRILRGNHPVPYSTSTIRERMLDKMSDVSRIVDRLIKKEYVKSNPCQKDKRLVDVNITPKGLRLLAKIDKVMPQTEQIYGKLNDNEKRQLSDLLDKLRS